MAGYLVSNLGKRKIELAIVAEGLNNFYLDIYLIPEDLIKNNNLKSEPQNSSKKFSSNFRTDFNS